MLTWQADNHKGITPSQMSKRNEEMSSLLRLFAFKTPSHVKAQAANTSFKDLANCNAIFSRLLLLTQIALKAVRH